MSFTEAMAGNALVWPQGVKSEKTRPEFPVVVV